MIDFFSWALGRGLWFFDTVISYYGFLLIPKDILDLNLSPRKMTVLRFLSKRPPRPPLHQPLYQHLVIAWADKNFEALLILQRNIHLYIMREVNLP
jgi:hypothetical protein